jgi:L-threonylcarbamoyladenylate synthase|tara:strand:- start:380 stop:922 length:543 start_codon:yes stop_codon:yes gene_type:complete
LRQELKRIITVLNNGGIILYPTDTIWGIGCDATNEQAVSKIFDVKKRVESKALISLVEDKDHLLKITNEVPKEAENIKPTTIIYNNISRLASNLKAQDGSAAVRIVQDNFCQKLIKKFKKPIIATSANITGENSPTKFSEISKEIKKNVDYIVNLRKNEIMSVSSSIIKINKDGSIQNIR